MTTIRAGKNGSRKGQRGQSAKDGTGPGGAAVAKASPHEREIIRDWVRRFVIRLRPNTPTASSLLGVMLLGETFHLANSPANLSLREVKLALDYWCRQGYLQRVQPEVQFGVAPKFVKLLENEAAGRRAA
jgi:hypothetical protein